MANRINRNLRWVKRQLDKAGMTDVLEEEILDAMSLTELEIMERSGDIRQIDTITFNATPPHDVGQYVNPAGTNRIVHISVPSSWALPFQFTNDAYIFAEVKEANPTGTQPLIAYAMNGSLYFWPIITDGSQVTLYSISEPSAQYGLVEGTSDPSVSWHWDMSLRYGSLAIVTSEEKWKKLYDEEYNKQAHSSLTQTAAPLQIDHSSRKLGF